MGAKDRGRANSGKLRVRDVIVILLCVSGAVYSIYLFWLDLNQTLKSQTEQVGTITIKNNIVQRRIAKRVIWDRLFNESPVYMGDMIRVAELSSADLNIDENKIGIEENTLILIQRSANGDLQINLSSGGLNFEAAPEGYDTAIVLNIMGHEVTANPGTKISAAAAEDGVKVQVIEGSAQIKSEGQERELSSGTMIALDTEGTERVVPAVVMLTPRPNAYYLSSDSSSQGVIFSWNRINLQPEDMLSLEIAEDRNFDRVTQRVNNLNTRAIESLNPGSSYWRLSLGSTVLSTGQITVTDAAGPVLMSPVRNQLVTTDDNTRDLSFQWTPVDEAAYYILQVGNTQNFDNLRISRQVGSNSFTEPNLEPGTWYWRVLPIFPSVYEGGASYSSPAVFRVMQTGAAVAALPEPEPVAMVEDPEESRLPLLAPPLSATPTPAQQRRQEAARPAPTPTPAPTPRPAAPVPAPAPARPAVTQTPTIPSSTTRPQVAPPPDAQPEIVPEPQPVAVPVRLLPAPENRQPAGGSSIGPAELRTMRNINFRWSTVPGANAYIFTLYHDSERGRREIVRSEPESRTSWTLDNMQLLDRGVFVWQVEAVNMEENGTIVQRGNIAENILILDIPLPGEVMLEQPGVLYGN